MPIKKQAGYPACFPNTTAGELLGCRRFSGGSCPGILRRRAGEAFEIHPAARGRGLKRRRSLEWERKREKKREKDNNESKQQQQQQPFFFSSCKNKKAFSFFVSLRKRKQECLSARAGGRKRYKAAKKKERKKKSRVEKEKERGFEISLSSRFLSL